VLSWLGDRYELLLPRLAVLWEIVSTRTGRDGTMDSPKKLRGDL
jgi:hypothetical protein